MKAFVVDGPRHASVQEVAYPTPGPGEVTVAVMRCGICGTDMHIYEGDFISHYPLIPGHEFAGLVHEVGAGVSDFVPGDRVAVDPSIFCGECEFCLSGRGNHCLRWGATGDTVNGAMAEYVKVPEHTVFHLPADMSFAQGAFIEPIACVVQGMRQLQLQVGQSVLLFGAGSMGQQLVQALVHAGAGELAVVDVSQAKLNLAQSFGATSGVLSKNLSAQLGHRKGHRGFDVVIDVTGIPAVIQSEFEFLAPKGTHLQFGVAPIESSVSIKPFEIYRNEWRLIGSMAVNHTFKAALQWMQAGRIQVEPLLSQEISLADLPSFFAQEKNPDRMKVQLTFERPIK